MLHEQRARDKSNHQLEIESLQHELDKAVSQHQSVKQFALDQARDSEEEIERLAALVEDLQQENAKITRQLSDRVHLEVSQLLTRVIEVSPTDTCQTGAHAAARRGDSTCARRIDQSASRARCYK